MFGVAKGTVCVIVNEVCQAIVKVLLERYVKFPAASNEIEDTVNEFETKCGFPQCIGAVDGTHLPTFAYISTTEMCQGLLQSKGFSFCHHASCCFTNIYIGWPGSIHDARVFKNSNLYRKGQNGSLDPTTGKIINGVKVPLVVLGDPVYPLLPWLMKPYTANGRLTPAAKTFNYRLSRARIVVENAFGRLRSRW